MHIAVVHVVEVQAGVALLRSLVAELQLTARLFYRVWPGAQPDGASSSSSSTSPSSSSSPSWLDVIIICEGEAESVEPFIETLRARAEPDDTGALFRGVCTLLRQWGYVLDPDPETCEAAQDETRHLGPVGLKGAEYQETKELAKRLERLKLGCDWYSVLMAAELNTAQCNRLLQQAGEPASAAEATPRKRCCTDPAASSMQKLTLSTKAVGAAAGNERSKRAI